MFIKFKQTGIFVSMVLVLFFQSQARTSKGDIPFNLNWKFIQGNPANAQSPSFNDAGWATVSVPHSASYDAPTAAAEHAFYKGDYWYRKTFTCPATARKVFINFGAIMQTATVYVNGTQVGTHDNSGYTGFFFDISNNVIRGGSTCIAVHCNVVYDLNIPPGGNGDQDPDFELFSGMYRDVGLLFKDSVYVPLRGQRITTPGSTTSASVRALTTVKNDAAASKSVTVSIALINASGDSVASGTLTKSVSPNSSSIFDLSTAKIAPSLWSPASPTLYSLRTLVSIGSTVVDSVVEQVGFRFFTWDSTRFYVNGTLTNLKGMCLAQFMGWVENAVPDSRFAKQVAMIKAMGINSIRCSHYPRADAFYRACDSLGMLVYVEVPTWGVDGGFINRTGFWNRIYSSDSAMVLDGYNHPSIYIWGLYNEQSEDLNSYFTNEMNIIHSLDSVSGSGRVCAVANFGALTNPYTADILAINYVLAFPGLNLNSEAYGHAMDDANEFGNWMRNYIRGGTMDTDPNGEALQEYNCMQNHYWGPSSNMAGAHFWCFMDYSSGRNTVGREGIVDRLWLPKQAYFLFRNKLTGIAPDYWTAGTPAKIDLQADLTTLKADGTDLTQIVATLRDAAGACVHTPCDITFTASPATSIAALYSGHSVTPTSGNPVTVPVEGGRAGILLRTTTTPGSITVTATSSCNLPSASVSVTSMPYSEPLTSVTFRPAKGLNGPALNKRLNVFYSGKVAIISFPRGADKDVRVLNSQGRTIAVSTLQNGNKCVVDRKTMENGILFIAWSYNGRKIASMVNGVH